MKKTALPFLFEKRQKLYRDIRLKTEGPCHLGVRDDVAWCGGDRSTESPG